MTRRRSLRLRADAKHRVADKLNMIGCVAYLLGTALLLTLVFLAIPIVTSNDQVTWNKFRGSPLSISEMILMGLGGVTFGVAWLLERSRRFNGQRIKSAMYAAIADALHDRGIRKAAEYLREHPTHLDVCLQLRNDIINAPVLGSTTIEDTTAIQTLIFSFNDRDPRQTSDAILHAISGRGLMSASEIKGLLEASEDVAPSLMDGAI